MLVTHQNRDRLNEICPEISEDSLAKSAVNSEQKVL